MKKLLLLLFALTITLGVHATEYKWEKDKNISGSTAAQFNLSLNSVNWTVDHESHTSSRSCQKDGNVPYSFNFGSATSPSKSVIFSAGEPFAGKKIVSVTVNVKKHSNAQTTFSVKLGNEAIGTPQNLATSFGDLKVEVNKALASTDKLQLIFENSNSAAKKGNGNGCMYIHGITVVYEDITTSEPVEFEAEFDAVNVEAGQEFTVAPKNQTAPAITYSITKNEGNIIEAIDEDNGKFKALAKGDAEITASWEGNDQWTAGSATIAVTVSAALKPVTITPSAETITIDLANSETAANPFTVDPEGLALSYESSAPEVVEVAADGTLTAKATGTAVVTASFAGNDEYRNAEAKVNVNVINSNALYTDINIENLINRDGDTGNSYAIERTYTDNQGISYLGHYNSNNGMQFNQGNSTDNGVIVSANPNKYKIESIEFTFAPGSRDNALTLYASNKAFNAVEETSEVLISDNIKKGTDNKVTVSFAQKDYCYFSMMAPSMLTLSNIRVNWVGQKAEKPSTPDVIYDSENNKFIINVDHGYHIHHYLEINNTPALATFAEAEPAWNKVENHTHTVIPERALEAGECYDLNVRAVDPEDPTNIAGNFIRVTSAGVVTGIEDVNIDENAKDERAFDIYGRAVSDDYKGLVIKGGKKYIRR